MLVQKLQSCAEFIAGDGTQLRELLHPDKQPIELRYSLAHAIVPVGQTSIPHSLKTSEVYYIFSGMGEMHIDNETQVLEPGDAVYIPQMPSSLFATLEQNPWCLSVLSIRRGVKKMKQFTKRNDSIF
jgi:mannose-6-phosphate isomerase-like protein (cupin superfamily)